MKNLVKYLSLLLIFVFVLAACGKPTADEPSVAEEPEVVKEPEVAENCELPLFHQVSTTILLLRKAFMTQ